MRVLIGLAVAASGWFLAAEFSGHVLSQFHDHGTGMLVSMVVAFGGGILAGAAGAAVTLWLEFR
jgi:hypothetical protein